MNLTGFFFILALIISVFFGVCTIALFICHLVIFHRVSKNFKAVKKDD